MTAGERVVARVAPPAVGAGSATAYPATSALTVYEAAVPDVLLSVTDTEMTAGPLITFMTAG